ncbi:hypothetical protein DW352_11725 [Pseudolabrys taiwanensis]|uniref:Uncharacterized protein n=1 Tax=Pseudolabrys taiwanensis TaxID=331696 RepID=A0A345ZW28_9HYPH|nr:hypothetical protein [Pseudolabrys taiwanensis]AXK81125.1 hypothetical protein DW352_11725 [Pseudolabrys taiwanensis]
MIDSIGLSIDVSSWGQTVSHSEDGKWPQRQFGFTGRPQTDHYFELVGDDLGSLSVNMGLIRGEYKPKDYPLERGIGTIAYASASPPDADLPGMDAMLHGWWWMPETLFDEVWLQAREHTWRTCMVQLEIAPVTNDVIAFQWDVTKRKVLHVLRASVSFNRAQPSVAKPQTEPRRRGLFG